MTDPLRYAAARRTLVGLVASCLAILPLRQIFTDWQWLLDAWIAMAITILPAAVLRMRWQPRLIQLLPGVVLVVAFLTARFVPAHAVAGVLPLHGAWKDVSALSTQFADTLRDETAPLASTPPVRMVLTAQLTLMAVAVDLLAVVARRPALAGVPFLLIYTLSGAVPRHAVGWVWFVAAGIAYLMLLASDSRDELSRWGRVMPRVGGGRAITAQALSGRRIGVIALALAVCVPLMVPVRAGNLLSDALHDNGSASFPLGGSGRAVRLDPFVSLKGSLTLGKPVGLLSVDARNTDGRDPFYLRANVLDSYNGKGWTTSDVPDSTLEDLGTTAFDTSPPAQRPDSTYSYAVTVTVLHTLGGNVPIFADPTSLSGSIDSRGWSPTNQLVVANTLKKGASYTEVVSEQNPGTTVLQDISEPLDQAALARWLQLPASTPVLARQLVAQLTGNISSPYRKAVAISNYFTNPANGFVYSLQTKAGDSTDDLTNFLKNKAGFCQQYAAAMGVMLRLAGVPARVVIGYTHDAPGANGQFVVTTSDAHAWVEAYIPSVGWLPFDPTPLSGADADRAVALPWAPHAANSGAGAAVNATSEAPNKKDLGSSVASSSAAAGGVQRGAAAGPAGPGWQAVLIVCLVLAVILILLVPALIRLARRRARLRASADGPDPLWQELADTAADLGYVWSPVRSPRQVVNWLDRQGLPGDASRSLGNLATVVERHRYAPPDATTALPADAVADDLVADLRRVESSLRGRRTRWVRMRARLLPESLGWLSWGHRGARH